MAVELYTSGKPAIPRRALFTSIFLLILASTLAAAMTRRRSGELLRPRIEPHGWSISFQRPREFPTGRFGPTKLGPAYLFHGRTRTGAPATRAVFRLEEVAAGDARAACERVLRAHMSLPLPTADMTRLTRFDSKFGSLDAAEIQDPQLGVVVRAAVLGDNDAYAVSLRVEGVEIDSQVYRLFDLTCGSIKYRPH